MELGSRWGGSGSPNPGTLLGLVNPCWSKRLQRPGCGSAPNEDFPLLWTHSQGDAVAVLQGWFWGMETPLVRVLWALSRSTELPHPSIAVALPWQPGLPWFHGAWASAGRHCDLFSSRFSPLPSSLLEIGVDLWEHLAATVVLAPGWRGATAACVGLSCARAHRAPKGRQCGCWGPALGVRGAGSTLVCPPGISGTGLFC